MPEADLIYGKRYKVTFADIETLSVAAEPAQEEPAVLEEAVVEAVEPAIDLLERAVAIESMEGAFYRAFAADEPEPLPEPEPEPEPELIAGPPPLGAERAAEIITEFYRGFLRREPDALAMGKAARLASGEATLEDMIQEFVGSEEYRNPPPPPEPPLTNDQTQYGEFMLLLARWIGRAVKHPVVVDVGARGRERSNSYDLMKHFGWRGYLVEANPSLIAPITEAFAGLDMDLINCAVSDYDGEATFYIGVNDDVSSLDQKASEGWGDLKGEVTVTVARLGPLLDARKVPKDFALLSIDIEGEDVKVLNDVVVNAGYRPVWVILEASYDFATKALEELPLHPEVLAAYDLVAQTKANLILERRAKPRR